MCYKYLSIDVGRKNLGFAYMDETNISFGLHMLDVNVKTTGPISRVHALNLFLSSFEFDVLIVERQVMANVIAMQLMSAIIMYCEVKGLKVIIFNPKDKFIQGENQGKAWKKKEHKKLSVVYASCYLSKCGSDLNEYKKKDDIADAILMLLKTKYTTEEYIYFISNS